MQGYDRLVDRWVSEVSLGVVDDEVGSVETGKGWFGMIRGTLLDEVENTARMYGEELTPVERELLRKADGVVVHEEAGGKVEVTYYDDKAKLEHAWSGIKQDIEMTYGTGMESRRRVK